MLLPARPSFPKGPGSRKREELPMPLPLLAVDLALWAQVPLAHLPYYWHLPILVVVISLVYSATRFDDWPLILREALRWGLRLVGFLLAILVVLYLWSSFL